MLSQLFSNDLDWNPQRVIRASALWGSILIWEGNQLDCLASMGGFCLPMAGQDRRETKSCNRPDDAVVCLKLVVAIHEDRFTSAIAVRCSRGREVIVLLATHSATLA